MPDTDRNQKLRSLRVNLAQDSSWREKLLSVIEEQEHQIRLLTSHAAKLDARLQRLEAERVAG